jgi:fermentation-respiration switch protein FrsA (DUF1100 family)
MLDGRTVPARHVPAVRLAFGLGVVASLLVLSVPLGTRMGAGVAALRFLTQFLTDEGQPLRGWWRPARPPRREAVRLDGGGTADLWRPAGAPPYRGAVLVHGLTPDGKDDRRLVDAAVLLARGGLAVLVPDLPAMRAQRLSPGDTPVVGDAVRRLAADRRVGGKLAVIAVSVGTAPVVSALADAEAGARVRLVATLGGHAEARELVRYFTTGAWGFGAVSGRVQLDPSLATAFVALNLDIVRDPGDRAAVAAALQGRPLAPAAGPEARAVLAVLRNRDPARVDPLLAALPPETHARLDALSPARSVRRLPGRLLIVHGRDDPAIPFTESVRLAAAADPTRSRLILVDLVGHVEGHLPSWRPVRDLLRLWSVAYELFRG